MNYINIDNSIGDNSKIVVTLRRWLWFQFLNINWVNLSLIITVVALSVQIRKNSEESSNTANSLSIQLNDITDRTTSQSRLIDSMMRDLNGIDTKLDELKFSLSEISGKQTSLKNSIDLNYTNFQLDLEKGFNLVKDKMLSENDQVTTRVKDFLIFVENQKQLIYNDFLNFKNIQSDSVLSISNSLSEVLRNTENINSGFVGKVANLTSEANNLIQTIKSYNAVTWVLGVSRGVTQSSGRQAVVPDRSTRSNLVNGCHTLDIGFYNLVFRTWSDGSARLIINLSGYDFIGVNCVSGNCVLTTPLNIQQESESCYYTVVTGKISSEIDVFKLKDVGV